jgi:hypothetical protein
MREIEARLLDNRVKKGMGVGIERGFRATFSPTSEWDELPKTPILSVR